MRSTNGYFFVAAKYLKIPQNKSCSLKSECWAAKFREKKLPTPKCKVLPLLLRVHPPPSFPPTSPTLYPPSPLFEIKKQMMEKYKQNWGRQTKICQKQTDGLNLPGLHTHRLPSFHYLLPLPPALHAALPPVHTSLLLLPPPPPSTTSLLPLSNSHPPHETKDNRRGGNGVGVGRTNICLKRTD